MGSSTKKGQKGKKDYSIDVKSFQINLQDK